MDFHQRWRERTKKQKEPQPSQTFVIGAEASQAQRAEEARLAKPNVEPSPLPPNLKFDSWRGHLDLVDPPRHPLDDELKALCDRFRGSDATERARLRDAARPFCRLRNERRQCGTRGGRPHRDRDDRARIDFRDPLHALSLLHHAGRRIGANVDDLMDKARACAEPKMAELILGFQKRSEDQRDIRKSWGHTMVETPAGPAFIHSGFEEYQPSYPRSL
jgi:hypothetical protein